MKLAVIPARGGSKRIPRKNIKAFAGKPMIAWSIEAALQSGCFDRVVVSTDDAEIAEVARQYGAQVPFMRPPELSDDHTGTSAVVAHAVRWMADEGQAPAEVCCIYATAPFVQADDLRRGLRILSDSGADYAFSVTTYAFPIQRAIRVTANKRVEMFEPAHFTTRSQDLEEAWHDAGQFYWGRAEAWLAHKPVFSQDAAPVPLPRHRVQDIDTPEDWERAEWMMKALMHAGSGGAARRRRVAFRTDASLQIGTGHVMRCLTLADALAARGADCVFLCRPHAGNLLGLIEQRGHLALALPAPAQGAAAGPAGPAHARWLGTDWATDAADTRKALGGEPVDWLVVDHYALDARWERELRSRCRQLMAIDDLADREHDCDLLFDQNWNGPDYARRYDGLVPAHCQLLLGPRHVLLRPEYLKLREWLPPRDGMVRRVLVFVGGSDLQGLTSRILRALDEPDLRALAADVVVGANYPDAGALAEQAARRPGTVLHGPQPSLAGLMARADLMIGAGGTTTWERMSLGLPGIVISVAPNQTPANQALHDAGYIDFLGEVDAVSAADIARSVRGCLGDGATLRARSRAISALVPGLGTEELCERLLG
ncbi:pseudaminic acid cytidylyltransferase [Massilia solisilvae]